jgi:hypothetical protein
VGPDIWDSHLLEPTPGRGPSIWEFHPLRGVQLGGTEHTDNTVFQNYLAFYNPLNILDPIGAPLLIGYGIVPGVNKFKGTNLNGPKLLQVSFIGLGEESLFRGFLFPALSDLFSSAILGAVGSSLAFGAIHTQYDLAGMAVVAAFGLVECLQIHLNKYDPRKNMFAHSWVDFFLLDPDGTTTSSNSASIPPVGARLNLAF